MAVLVTGGAGYIGSHTVVELLEKDYEVVVVDNFSNSNRESLKRVREITGKDFEFYEADVNDRESLHQIFEEQSIDAVIHFAGYKAVGESVAQPLMYYHNNVGNTIALLEVMADHQVSSIVFSSSATVYGVDNESPLTEDMPTDTATNPYGYTKVVVEHLLRDLHTAQPHWSVAILRYFNPIGAHASGLIGEDPRGIPNNLMPYISQVAIGQREHLSVFGGDYETPDGTGVRDYIHVVDLAKGHLAALETHGQEPGVFTYNLGTGQGYSVLDLVTTFEKINDVRVPYEIVDRRPGDLATVYADPHKAKEELGWTATHNLEDMCRDTWKWQCANPQGYETVDTL